MSDRDRELMERIEELERTIARLEARRGRLRRIGAAWSAHPSLRAAIGMTVLLVPLAAYASTLNVPFSFVNGTPADADEVNANFSAVESAVNDNHSRISVLEAAPTPGDITGVLAGTGLTGGGTSGTVSLSTNPSTTQTRVTGTCAAGSSIRAIAQNGTVTCETDDVGAGGGGDITDVLAGSGLTGGGSTGSVSLAVAPNGIDASHVQNGSLTGTDILNGSIEGVDILSTTSATLGGLAVNGSTTLNGAVTVTGGNDIRVHDSNAYLRFYDSAGSSELLYLFSQPGVSWLYHSSAGRYVYRSDGNGLGIGTAPSVGADVTMTSLQLSGSLSVGYTRVSSQYSLANSGTCSAAGNLTCYYGIGTAVCPAGTNVLGGGAIGASARFGAIGYSYPIGDDRWSCATSYDSPATHTCYAVCARID